MSKKPTQGQAIQWTPKQVNVADVKPTEKNYKIKTDIGRERLQLSLKLYGLAGTVVVNTDMTLIDGNSRLLEAKEKGEKKIWVSIPNRKLTPKEFQEMSAMYDFAKAGEIDMDRIEQDLGTTAEFFNRWKMSVPMHVLEKMGAKSPVSGKLEYPEEGVEAEVADIKMVQLFFTNSQEIEFRKMEDRLKVKLKTANTTDTVLKAFKALLK